MEHHRAEAEPNEDEEMASGNEKEEFKVGETSMQEQHRNTH